MLNRGGGCYLVGASDECLEEPVEGHHIIPNHQQTHSLIVAFVGGRLIEGIAAIERLCQLFAQSALVGCGRDWTHPAAGKASSRVRIRERREYCIMYCFSEFNGYTGHYRSSGHGEAVNGLVAASGDVVDLGEGGEDALGSYVPCIGYAAIEQ